MILTPRGIGIGLASWGLAFLIAVGGRVSPFRLNVIAVAVLAFSLVVGLLALRLGCRRICRSGGESGAALMTFLTAWFTGIYAPITAIWANGSLYRWAIEQKAKPSSDALGVRLVSAIEKTAATHFLGVGVLLAVGYLVMRNGRRSGRVGPNSGSTFEWALAKTDIAFGAAAVVTGLAVASIGPGPKLTDAVQVFGCVCGAFLLCFLFRSLRMQRAELKTQLPDADGVTMTKKAGAFCTASLGISWGLFWLLSRSYDLFDDWGLALCLLIFLSPWFVFRKAGRRSVGAPTARLHAMNRFAIRCGVWSWLCCSLMISGLVMPGIAESELIKAGTVPTPFALAVLAMKPIFCISILPGVGTSVVTFVVAWALPRSAPPSERVLACAQAGAVGSVVSFVTVILFALTLALGTVTSIGVAQQVSQESPRFHRWFAEGYWVSLGRLNMLALGAGAAAVAVLWAAEAMLECWLDWLIDRIGRKRNVATKQDL